MHVTTHQGDPLTAAEISDICLCDIILVLQVTWEEKAKASEAIERERIQLQVSIASTQKTALIRYHMRDIVISAEPCCFLQWQALLFDLLSVTSALVVAFCLKNYIQVKFV